MNSSSNYHSKWNSFLLCFNERRKVLFRIKMEKFPSLVFCYVTLKTSNHLYSASSHSFSLIIYSPELCTSKYQNKTCLESWPFFCSILCKIGFYSSCCCCLEKHFCIQDDWNHWATKGRRKTQLWNSLLVKKFSLLQKFFRPSL